MSSLGKSKRINKLNNEYKRMSEMSGWSLSSNFVKGDGPVDADIMIVGQAPGRNEDTKGKPFIGMSGKMLNELLSLSGIDRNNVYITSTVQFFPPKNRMPTKKEIELCAPMLKKQIEIVDPKIVITLGSLAANTTVGIDNIMHNHGLLTHDGDRYYFSTLHPAAAVRLKKNVPIIKDDFKRLGTIVKKLEAMKNKQSK